MHLVTLALAAGKAAPADMRWDGIYGAIAGALIGGVVSAVVALMVVRLTQQADRRKTRAQQGRTAAGLLSVGLISLREDVMRYITSHSALERTRARQDISVESAQLIHLHAPLLEGDALKGDLDRAHGVIIRFLDLSRDVDNGKQPMPLPRALDGAWRLPGDTWHPAAARLLSDYLADLTQRLTRYRLGKPPRTVPIPDPKWPDVPTPTRLGASSAATQAQAEGQPG